MKVQRKKEKIVHVGLASHYEWMKITEYKDFYENYSENDNFLYSSDQFDQYGSKGNGWIIS